MTDGEKNVSENQGEIPENTPQSPNVPEPNGEAAQPALLPVEPAEPEAPVEEPTVIDKDNSQEKSEPEPEKTTDGDDTHDEAPQNNPPKVDSPIDPTKGNDPEPGTFDNQKVDELNKKVPEKLFDEPKGTDKEIPKADVKQESHGDGATNIGGIGNVGNLTINAPIPKRRKVAIDDVSKEVAIPAAGNGSKFSEEKVTQFTNKLLKERVLLISSSGQYADLAFEAMRLVVGELEKSCSDLTKRVVKYEREEKVTSNIEIDDLCCGYEGLNNVLFYFNTSKPTNQLAKQLYDTTFNVTGVSILKQGLTDNKRFVVCLCKDINHFDEIHKADSIFRNSFWILDAKSFKTKTIKAKPKIAKESPSIRQVFDENNIVYKVVLFVGTYFPQLDTRGFEHVVRFFLKAQSEQEVDCVKKVVKLNKKGEPKIDKKGNRIYTNEITQESTLEHWSRHKDEIFERCYLLRSRSVETSEYEIDFEYDLRQEAETLFESRKFTFLEGQFGIMETRAMIFDDGLSMKIIEMIVGLTIKVIDENPQYYGHQWLAGYISNILKAIESEFDHRKEEHVLLKLHALVTNQHLKSKFLYRIIYLLKVFMEIEHLRPMVKGFLDKLIESNYYGELLNTLPLLAGSLRNTSDFNKYYWYRTLLDQDDEKSLDFKEQVYQLLYKPDDEEDWNDAIHAVQAWLPQASLAFEAYNGSHHAAMHFWVQHHIRELINHPKSDADKDFNPFFIWKPTAGKGEEVAKTGKVIKSEILNLIINTKGIALSEELMGLYGNILLYLSHNELEFLPSFSDVYVKNDIRIFHADIVEGWFAMLYGWHEFTPSEEADELATAIISTIKEALSKKDFEVFVGRWVMKVNVYDRIIGLINERRVYRNEQCKSMKQAIKVRRKTIFHIKKILRSKLF